MCAEFLKVTLLTASQKNAKNHHKMPKFIKASEVKKYSKIASGIITLKLTSDAVKRTISNILDASSRNS